LRVERPDSVPAWGDCLSINHQLSTLNFSESARRSKRTGELIPRIALDECRVPERYRTRAPIVPIAQYTERARPKRQVAGESPAGDTKTKSSNNQAPSSKQIPSSSSQGPAQSHRGKIAENYRDTNFRRVVRGEQQTHLTQNQAALDVQVVSRRPVSSPSKHF